MLFCHKKLLKAFSFFKDKQTETEKKSNIKRKEKKNRRYKTILYIFMTFKYNPASYL